MLPDDAFKAPVYDVHAEIIGPNSSLTSDNNAPGICSHEGSAPGSTSNGPGIKTVTWSAPTATPTSYNIKQVSENTGECTNPAVKEPKFLVIQDHEGDAICKDRAEKSKLIDRPINQTAEAPKTNHKAQAPAMLQTEGQIPTGQSSDNKQQSVMTALGGGAENLVKSYDEAVASTQISYLWGADDVEASIRDSAKPKNFCKALAISFSRDEEARDTKQKALLKDAKTIKECKEK
ncbi:variant surface glycoprotein (VSG), putative [Trypanosoma equiperdum]|uniref:Variant surface glycoprotein (VSG), putative n=1 Tax=Trypanosoma equiperdum TaxID=5694 RepID=A0A1G4HYK5_TRYEQ|nr:variant surface glycoprotein (VSG), putative [Trypanosoma equiperdum]